jgi:hypothetical protein
LRPFLCCCLHNGPTEQRYGSQSCISPFICVELFLKLDVKDVEMVLIVPCIEGMGYEFSG